MSLSNGRAGGTRTPDHRIRNQVLYPAELLPHGSRTRVTSRNETRRFSKTQDRKQGDFTAFSDVSIEKRCSLNLTNPLTAQSH